MELHRGTPTAATPPITDDEAAALARSTVNLFQAWELSDAESCTLLGGIAKRTWARWKDGQIGRIERDLRLRLALLIGIHKGLRHMFREPGRGYAWIRKPNAAFEGLSALDVMLRGEMTDLLALRDWLNAERGV
ncbi:MbcA/ParS/Xre antitoxin family protein [Roseivivax sp. GX 12232]|uniref:MbcA/ParS/Xre antitoxin family protein n=1 Tax=Roseivivax sp. GX 12232 TaxID=2900547 RepID=UPI001E3F9D31|nr:MbcA/ParS/Xre antitoxin family protein [Roseivivax sp. GX 12232]MCE0507287.1 MbcA/ParS/Xre antitoxin family protein [Roseivivax sp. GX 12232]